jgi:anti-sigma factor ChrR (cupin superfamily)
MSDALTHDELELLDRIVAETIAPCDPPPEVRAHVLESIRRAPQLDESVPGEHESRTVRADEGTWKTVAPGARMKRLSKKDDRRVVFLLEMEPFAVVDAHDHAGGETSYVIRGSCRIGALGLGTGDYHTVDAGAHHGDVTAGADGCVLLLTLEMAA